MSIQWTTFLSVSHKCERNKIIAYACVPPDTQLSFHVTGFRINQTSIWSHLRHYELKRNEDIVSFFNDFSDHLAEEALWELSLKIKPRNITRRKTDREEKT